MIKLIPLSLLFCAFQAYAAVEIEDQSDFQFSLCNHYRKYAQPAPKINGNYLEKNHQIQIKISPLPEEGGFTHKAFFIGTDNSYKFLLNACIINGKEFIEFSRNNDEEFLAKKPNLFPFKAKNLKASDPFLTYYGRAWNTYAVSREQNGAMTWNLFWFQFSKMKADLDIEYVSYRDQYQGTLQLRNFATALHSYDSPEEIFSHTESSSETLQLSPL